MTTLKSQHRTGVTTGYLSNVVKSKFKFQCARGLLWGARRRRRERSGAGMLGGRGAAAQPA